MVKSNRSLLTYILLTIITCGIYSFVFLHGIARDVNTVCDGDGSKTPGLLKFILLNIITCGIYGWVWDYKIGNRLAQNASKYGLSFVENGTSILMWDIFGLLLCGLGPLFGTNIIIKNTNALANAYNQQHGYTA